MPFFASSNLDCYFLIFGNSNPYPFFFDSILSRKAKSNDVMESPKNISIS